MNIRRILDVEFLSQEASRQIVLWISIFLMIPFWLLLAFFCWVFWHAVFTDEWDIRRFGIAVFLTVLVVFGIPFQFIRYFRELRELRAARREL